MLRLHVPGQRKAQAGISILTVQAPDPIYSAAVSQARVRSRISSCSNSASAAKVPNTRRPAAAVVSILRALPGEHPSAHAAGRQVLHGVAQVRGCGRGGRASRRRAHRQSGACARSCQAPVGRRGRRTRRRGRRGRRRRPRPAARRAAGPATGSRPPLRRGRSRSACVVNGRLRHTVADAVRRAPPCVVSRVGFYLLQRSSVRLCETSS